MSISLKRAGGFGLVVAAALAAVVAYSLSPFTPLDQPYRSTPPLAITGFDVSGGAQKVFQTWFDPTSFVWRGEVSAYPVNNNGQVDTNLVVWRASERLKAQNIISAKAVDPANCAADAWNIDGRRIVTRSGSTNIGFRWANLSAAQKGSIDADATTGEKILNFVRGDPKNEDLLQDLNGDGTPGDVVNPCASPTGTFRSRYSVLGDIINARPIHVGTPAANYSFDGYANFKLANAKRAGRVYVGANDGMLHAFDAATGDEVFAYVPSMLIPNLNKLKADPYVHTYFVDGGMAVGDAYFAAPAQAIQWHTVLVGGLGAGGRGLFALDVTDPAAATEDTAKAKIMWEITSSSTGFSELGYTYGDAAIARLNNGKWVAISGNGYNAGGSSKSVLYVIDIVDGSLIKSITVGTGNGASPGGLSSPRVVDTNSDGKADVVYAGDIDGKLWKFDISNTDPASWTSSELYDAGVSITGTPDIVPHPLGGLLVYFGTGRLFTKASMSDATIQNYAYAIWDGAPAENTAVLEQTLARAEWPNPGDSTVVRVSSGNAINWDDATKTRHKGWRTKLALGEHIVGSGFVRDARYHFTSYNPTIAGTPPGESWIMELDYLNGSTNGSPIFDLSHNDKLDDPDRIRTAGDVPVAGPGGVPIGILLGGGLFSEPLLALVSAQLSVTLFNQNILPVEAPIGCTSNCGSGIAGGHFDWDVYHSATAGSFKHIHEYDDKFDVVGTSFTNASDPTYNLANTGISGNRVIPAGTAGASKFFVLLSNGDLSPGVTFTVGNKTGDTYKAFKYPNLAIIADVMANGDTSQYLFDSATVKKFHWVMPTDGLTAKSWGQTPNVVRPGLIPTQTGCVKSGTLSNPGLYGENNNGALTVWIVKYVAGTDYNVGKGVIAENRDPTKTLPAGVTADMKGYKVVNDTVHLKHYTMFWHASGGCYGSGGWNPTPTPEEANDGGGTHPPGSEDPVAFSSGGAGAPSAVKTEVGFTPSDTFNGKGDLSGTRTTTTHFSDGSQLIVTEIIKKDGKVDTKKTTTRSIPGTPTAGGPTTVTGAAGSKVVTSEQELRNAGRLGRVSWHELIRD